MTSGKLRAFKNGVFLVCLVFGFLVLVLVFLLYVLNCDPLKKTCWTPDLQYLRGRFYLETKSRQICQLQCHTIVGWACEKYGARSGRVLILHVLGSHNGANSCPCCSIS